METSVPRFLWKYARKLKYALLLMISLLALSMVCARFVNYFSAEIVQLISANPPSSELFSQIMLYALYILLMLFLDSVINVSSRLIDMKFIPYYISHMSKDLFVYAHKHSTAFFSEEMAGNVSGKIRNILTNTEMMYYGLIEMLIAPLLGTVIALSFIAVANVKLALAFTGMMILFFAFSLYIRRKMKRFSELKAKLMSESNGILVDSIANSDLVKNCANFHYEKRRYYDSVRKATKALRNELKAALGRDYLSSFFNDVMNFIFYAMTFIYWYKYEMSVGDVVLVLSLISTLIKQVHQMTFFATRYIQGAGNIKDGLDLLAKPYDVVDVKNAENLSVTEAAVSFDKVNYHYKDAQALFAEFNLSIQPGEKIGLVGRSGSGKSTLIKLLSRYYDVQSGEITIDGQNIAKVTQDSLRKNIALIPQDPSLFNRTIMENIRYGNIKATDEEVYEAARKAYIHDYIMTLPQGYQSKVGERGVMLSGGERQRIAIARAILKNAPILILDEATSALDSESEHFIQEALRDLMKGKTVIAIAHRLSTLKEMNKIVVMDKGKIIESGTHTALIRKKGAYYNFYNMQSSGFLKPDEDN